MNQIIAWGSTKKKRALAEDVVNFCIERLMPRMKTLDICIQLSNDLEYHSGFCLSVTNREFVIEIDAKESTDDMIETVCHEMVHVKQHARNELKDTKFIALKKWKGEEHIAMYTTLDEYMNLPWEKEAYELETILRDEYKLLKSNKKVFSKKS